ncbi:MAG: DUF421 domain-containing protein [Coprobacillus cateniformis]|uniref:DUF421 domain-containing protein n=1 Tax=Longibaculum muris TaxID=1796628 RepID=UPI003AB2B507|nr:DUF421 domain-containing protein [Coprobacillus cateniformis]
MKYVEIFIECIATYFYLVFLLRYLGKKEMGKLSVSDLIVFLLISELMTLSIGNEEVNFFHGALAALVIIVLDKLCSYAAMKFKPIKKVLEGHPTFIVNKGKLNQEKMEALNYSIDDLCHHLRLQGIGSLSEVEFAILETDGQLSVIETQKSQVEMPDSLIVDGEMNHEALNLMGKNEDWLKKKLRQHGVNDYKDIFYCVMEKERLFFIKK